MTQKLYQINVSFFFEAEKREVADKAAKALRWITGRLEEGEEERDSADWWKGQADFEIPMDVIMHVKEVPDVCRKGTGLEPSE